MKLKTRIFRKQNGMSMVSWLLLLGLVIVISIPATKIAQIYINSLHIASALKDIELNKLFQLNINDPKNIKTKLLKSLAILNVTEVTPDEITVTNADDKCIVRIQHHYKEKILYDRNFTLDVDESVELPTINK
ncbi:MAG: hypothetical protein ABSE54_01415 [Smithella sp.]|jgi:hypothetical protein